MPRLKKSKARCPRCKSSAIMKNGYRFTIRGKEQRFLCKACGHCFVFGTSKRKVKELA